MAHGKDVVVSGEKYRELRGGGEGFAIEATIFKVRLPGNYGIVTSNRSSKPIPCHLTVAEPMCGHRVKARIAKR
jgi:hypothetical protein